MHNNTLRNLNLSYNELGPEGSRVIAGALRKQSIVLEFLDLGHNCIGPGGGMAIAKALEASPNYTLKTIVLAGNGLKQPEIKAVSDSLRLDNQVRNVPDKWHLPTRETSKGWFVASSPRPVKKPKRGCT